MLEIVRELLRKKLDGAEFVLEPPEIAGRGHVATNAAFALAEKEETNPMDAAKSLQKYLEDEAPRGFFERIEIAEPGFLNILFSKGVLQKEFEKIAKAGDKWGQLDQKGTVVIDYSAPNIAKPMSVGHFRSTIIGQSLKNIFQFAGWKALGDNHLGDWGTQFGMLIAAYKDEIVKTPELENPSVQDLLKLYVDYNTQMEDNPGLRDRAREETVRLQSGDKANRKIWEKFVNISKEEFKKVYDLLGIEFDYELAESAYNDELPKIVERALKDGVATESEGAVVIPLEEEGLSPFLIRKSDGSYLYTTTDIATFLYRQKHMKPNLILYVVGNPQSLHFQQLFMSLRKMGVVRDEQLVHVKFGQILSADRKKLSTRAGTHIPLLDVVDEAVKRANAVVQEKQADLDKKERERIAKIVGVGALKYNDLSQNRQSDIAFDWDKILSLEGNSGPYLQYTYTRLRSILEKAGHVPKLDAKALQGADLELVMKLAEFPGVIERVTKTYFPHYLALYLHDLAKAVNSFYEKEPVLKAEEKVRDARLNLVEVSAQTLKTGLNLLGIETVEKM